MVILILVVTNLLAKNSEGEKLFIKYLDSLSQKDKKEVLKFIDSEMVKSYSNGYDYYHNKKFLPFAQEQEDRIQLLKINQVKTEENQKIKIEKIKELHAIDLLRKDLEKQSTVLEWQNKANRRFVTGLFLGGGITGLTFTVNALIDFKPAQVDIFNN